MRTSVMLFQLKINEVSNQIESNSSKVEELQEENKLLKDYLQQLGSASKASESALQQLKTAFFMLKNIDASQLEVLKQEIDNLYFQIKNNEINPQEKLEKSQLSELNLDSEINSKKEKSEHKSITKSSTSNAKKKQNQSVDSEAKVVEVEVLEPEVNNSNYEAVLKLKQLLS